MGCDSEDAWILFELCLVQTSWFVIIDVVGVSTPRLARGGSGLTIGKKKIVKGKNPCLFVENELKLNHY